jgi:hypothetical protein
MKAKSTWHLLNYILHIYFLETTQNKQPSPQQCSDIFHATIQTSLLNVTEDILRCTMDLHSILRYLQFFFCQSSISISPCTNCTIQAIFVQYTVQPWCCKFFGLFNESTHEGRRDKYHYIGYNNELYTKHIHKISSAYCHCSAAVTMVRMRAEFIGPLGRHWRRLQTIEPRLHYRPVCLQCSRKSRSPPHMKRGL